MAGRVSLSVFILIIIGTVCVQLAQSADLRRQKRQSGGGVDPVELCLEPGRNFTADPENCAAYFQCVFGWPFLLDCAAGTVWDERREVCDYPYAAQNEACGHEYTGPPPFIFVDEFANFTGTMQPFTTPCEVQCATTDQCIFEVQVCNDVQDCEDNSDETGCAPPASECNSDNCSPPECTCPGSEPDMELADRPQIVMVTFEDAIHTAEAYHLFRQVFRRTRQNPNGCATTGTFFVSHEYTDYAAVQLLYKAGHDIASQSISYRIPQDYWKAASQEDWKQEIADHRIILSKFANVDPADVIGMRAPYLQPGGNRQYQMMADNGFVFDSTLINRNATWPFTLDYRQAEMCSVLPCPTASFPGLWEIPHVYYRDINDTICASVDQCLLPRNKDESLQFLKDNFDKHYSGNKAPFPLFLRSRWFYEGRDAEGRQYNLQALEEFLDDITSRDDVWLVPMSQVVQWARDPVPNSRAGSVFTCDYESRPAPCSRPKNCVYLEVLHEPNPGERYIRTCLPPDECPPEYPYTGNPSGAATGDDSKK